VKLAASIALAACVLFARAACAQRQMEFLGRGLVAIPQGGGRVFISWRLLGTEPDDVAFNLYRVTENAEPVKLNMDALRDVTCFIDVDVSGDKTNAWFVRSLTKDAEEPESERFVLKGNAPAQPYLSVP
jgi:rhamnogalacturonan endolyase